MRNRKKVKKKIDPKYILGCLDATEMWGKLVGDVLTMNTIRPDIGVCTDVFVNKTLDRSFKRG